MDSYIGIPISPRNYFLATFTKLNSFERYIHLLYVGAQFIVV